MKGLWMILKSSGIAESNTMIASKEFIRKLENGRKFRTVAANRNYDAITVIATEWRFSMAVLYSLSKGRGSYIWTIMKRQGTVYHMPMAVKTFGRFVFAANVKKNHVKGTPRTNIDCVCMFECFCGWGIL